MAPKQSIVPREGVFTMDTVINVVKKLALNPSYSLPIFLLLRYTRKGQDLAADHQSLFKTIRGLLIAGVFRKFSDYLNNGARNNWVKDPTWDWNKEIAIVTGGSGGIGSHVVKGLAAKGVKVVVLDVMDLTFEAPANVFFYKCDISSTEKLAEVAAEIRENVGHPTIIVNNAGVARGKDLLESTERDVRFTFDVNTLSHYWILKEFLPNIIKNNHGHIVTVASIAGYQTAQRMVDYGASKAAAISFHEGISLELKHRYNAPRVRTTLITQGFTKTAMFTGFKSDSHFLFPAQYPESIADGIVNQIFAGEGNHLFFPKSYGFLPGWRGQEAWLQLGVSNMTKDLMNNFSGRQIVDPKSESKDDEATEDVSKSGVLVDKS